MAINSLTQGVSHPFVQAFSCMGCGRCYFRMNSRGDTQGQLTRVWFLRDTALLLTVSQVMVNSIMKIFSKPRNSFPFKGNAVFYTDNFPPKDVISVIEVDFRKIPFVCHVVHGVISRSFSHSHIFSTTYLFASFPGCGLWAYSLVPEISRTTTREALPSRTSPPRALTRDSISLNTDICSGWSGKDGL